MCGIFGFVGRETPGFAKRWNAARPMQRHRGPDDEGEFVSRREGTLVALAHQRLSIIDLSNAGHQPMAHPDGHAHVVYNGEVYNYVELRRKLEREGCIFHGESDTEVVIHAIAKWGITEACRRFNGMWALAYIDLKEQRLTLSRDRFGKKPLYWSRHEEGLYFASELKTIPALTGRRYSLNHQYLGEIIDRSQFGTRPQSCLAGIDQLPPAHHACISLHEISKPFEASAYWTLPGTTQDEDEHEHDHEALAVSIREKLIDAVNLRLRSDVPVGVLLSGGIDSSIIAAAVHKSGQDVAFLSGISSDKRFDESPHIRKVAAHFNSDVTYINTDNFLKDLFNQLERLTWNNDQPLSSFSNITHNLLIEAGRKQGLKVVLTGQGADELFGGYKKYLGFRIQELVRAGELGKAVKLLHLFHRNGTVLSQFNRAAAGRYLPRFLQGGKIDVLGEAMHDYAPVNMGLPPGCDFVGRQALDFDRFSLPGILHTEDRMSMASSSEVRVPFLDYRFVELCLPLPPDTKLHGGWTKYILRKAFENDLPKDVIWRKDKMGFATPQSEWIKHELRDRLEQDYFAPDSLMFQMKLINRSNMLKKFNNYIAQKHGRGNIYDREILSPVLLEIWLRKFEKFIAA